MSRRQARKTTTLVRRCRVMPVLCASLRSGCGSATGSRETRAVMVDWWGTECRQGGAPPDAFFAGLARAKFGRGMAPAGTTTATKKALGGLQVSPRTRGVTREAIQEFGGWKSSGVMELVYDAVRSAEAVPETQAAAWATDRMEMGRSLRGLNGDLALLKEDEVGYSTRVVVLSILPWRRIPRRRIRCNSFARTLLA